MTRNYLTVVNKLWIIRNINEINCNFLDQTGNRYGVVLLHVGSSTPVMSIVVKGLVGIDCELISVNDALRVNYDQYWFANKWATIHQHLPYEVYNVWSKIIIIVWWNIIFKQFGGILDIYTYFPPFCKICHKIDVREFFIHFVSVFASCFYLLLAAIQLFLWYR